MFAAVRSRLTFANVVAMLALFVALGGSSYAALRVGSKQIVNNSIRRKDIRNGQVASQDIKNNDVRSGDIRNGEVGSNDIRNDEVGSNDIRDNDLGSTDFRHQRWRLQKGFATIQARNTNGPANVLNYGGQQTSTDQAGVTAERVGTGVCSVTFLANTATGRFTNVDAVNDLTWQVTGRNGFSTGSVFDAAGTASENILIKVRIFMRRPDNGGVIDSSFSVQFFARTTP